MSAIGLGVGILGIVLTILIFGVDKLTSSEPVTKKQLDESFEALTDHLLKLREFKAVYSNHELGVVVIIGDEDPSGIPVELSIQDIALGLRLAKTTPDGQSFGCSFDESPGNEGTLDVRFQGDLYNTHLGVLLFQADYALKKYALGVQPDGVEIATTVRLFGPILERLESQKNGSNEAARFWLTAGPSLHISNSSNLMTIEDPGIIVKAEAISARSGSRIAPQAAPRFVEMANLFTEHFATLSMEAEGFSAFSRIVQVIAVTKWLSEHPLIDELDWLDSFALQQTYDTPKSIPKISITRERTETKDEGVNVTTMMNIQGGVSLAYNSFTYSPPGSFNLELERILSTLPVLNDTPTTGDYFQFEIAGNEYAGYVLYAR